MSSSKNNTNLFTIILVFLSVVFVSGSVFYQLLPKNHTFIFNNAKKPVYILISDENEIYLNSINTPTEFYENNLEKFKTKLRKLKIKALFINENSIRNLKPDDILFILDTYYISDNTMDNIKNFLKSGGNLIFNYNFGFVRQNRFVKAKSVEEITDLKFITDSIDKNETRFFVPKLLSPLVKGDNDQRRNLILYSNDTLPIFRSSHIPDALITNWAITSTPKFRGKLLNVNESGIIWHGFYNKGKWFYFSFPSYVLTDMNNGVLKKYLNNIFHYFKNSVTVAKYPFIDSKNAVFVSEDTEYKYKNMIHFAKLSNQYDIPVTLFCVAKLAKQNKEITKEASGYDNVEIGSHSYSHTKIIGAKRDKLIKEIKYSKEVLEKITGKTVYGFRPPREQIDKAVKDLLVDAGYKYYMAKTKKFLLPKYEYEDLITIPRHGTDDYAFLINLEWNKKEILNKIIQETKLLTSVNSLYTLSVHTHLLSYKTNLDILKKYFIYLKKHPYIHPYKGYDIAKKAELNSKISITTQDLNDQSFIYIHNDNDEEIRNFKIRIYWPNCSKITITPEVSSVKFKILTTNYRRKYTDVSIEKLKPDSTLSLIIGTK
jgi:peptidoglycan/xylan/chitin deacetylase (PgdA/CDA1 family)